MVTLINVLDLIALIGAVISLAVPRLRKYALDFVVAPFAFATAAVGGFILVALFIALASQFYGLALPNGIGPMCAFVSSVETGLGGIVMSHKILHLHRLSGNLEQTELFEDFNQ